MDHSLFDAFFDDTSRKECCECHTSDDLVPVGSCTGGAQLYLCTKCKAKRDAGREEHEAQQAAKVTAEAARDEWEEG